MKFSVTRVDEELGRIEALKMCAGGDLLLAATVEEVLIERGRGPEHFGETRVAKLPPKLPPVITDCGTNTVPLNLPDEGLPAVTRVLAVSPNGWFAYERLRFDGETSQCIGDGQHIVDPFSKLRFELPDNVGLVTLADNGDPVVITSENLRELISWSPLEGRWTVHEFWVDREPVDFVSGDPLGALVVSKECLPGTPAANGRTDERFYAGTEINGFHEVQHVFYLGGAHGSLLAGASYVDRGEMRRIVGAIWSGGNLRTFLDFKDPRLPDPNVLELFAMPLGISTAWGVDRLHAVAAGTIQGVKRDPDGQHKLFDVELPHVWITPLDELSSGNLPMLSGESLVDAIPGVRVMRAFSVAGSSILVETARGEQAILTVDLTE